MGSHWLGASFNRRNDQWLVATSRWKHWLSSVLVPIQIDATSKLEKLDVHMQAERRLGTGRLMPMREDTLNKVTTCGACDGEQCIVEFNPWTWDGRMIIRLLSCCVLQ